MCVFPIPKIQIGFIIHGRFGYIFLRAPRRLFNRMQAHIPNRFEGSGCHPWGIRRGLDGPPGCQWRHDACQWTWWSRKKRTETQWIPRHITHLWHIPHAWVYIFCRYNIYVSLWTYGVYFYDLYIYIWFVWFIWSQNLLGVLIVEILHACDGNERSQKTMTVNMAGVYKRVLLT